MTRPLDTILAVGPIPPPYDGQSVAFALLVRTLGDRGISHKIFDISPRTQQRGRTFFQRLVAYTQQLPSFTWTALRHRGATVYITIAQSRRGFFRDAAFVWLARLASSRVVAHLHGGNYAGFYATQSPWLRLWIRATLRRIDRIIVLGESLRSMFDFLDSMKPQVCVVQNGLPNALPAAIRTKDLPAAGSSPIRLLYLSNLIESKGYFDLLEAVRILHFEKGLDLCVDFCGDFVANPSDDRRVRDADHARALFAAFVRENGLDGFVRYRGVVTGERKEELLASAHFLVLPTRYDNEGQPISILEAMAHGCVVIATNHRAIPEMIEHATNGWLVPFDSPEKIAEGIALLVENPDWYRRMSDAAKATVGSRFTQEAHVERLLAVLAGTQS